MGCTHTSLSTNEGDSFLWSTNETTNSIIVSTPGTYCVTVTNNTNTCTSETCTTVTNAESLILNLETPKYICEGESICLENGANGYEWVSSGSNCFSQDTTFTISIGNSENCPEDYEIEVIVGSAPAQFVATPPDITLSCGMPIPPLTDLAYSNNMSGACESSGSITGIQTGTIDSCIGGTIQYIWAGSDTNGNLLEHQQTITVTPSAPATLQNVPPDIVIQCGDAIPPIVDIAFTNNLGGSCENSGFIPGTMLDNSSICGGSVIYIWEGTDNCGNILSHQQVISIASSPETWLLSIPLDVTLQCGEEIPPLDTLYYDNGLSFSCQDTGPVYGEIIDNTDPCLGGEAIYEWSGEDSCGNPLSHSRVVTVLPCDEIDVAISGSLTYCSGASTTLDAGAGFASYNWTDGSTTQTITISGEGQYCVTVTDTNGCTASDCLDITESTSLEPYLLGDDFCEGESMTIDAGAGFVSYLWSDFSIAQTIQVSQSGTYCVTVSDASGCTGENCITVTASQNPEPILGGPFSLCEGGNILLDAGTSYIDFSWSDGSLNQTLEVAQAGTYCVTVTSADGCTGSACTDIDILPEIAPTISGSTSFCEGQSTTLDAKAGFSSYEWSTGETTQIIVADVSGSYSVTVSDASGCTGSAIVEVIESSSLQPVIVGNTDFCEGESTVLDAGFGFDSYQWTTGENTQSINVSLGGTYCLIVSDANGCTGEACITITEYAAETIIIEGPSSICDGNVQALELCATGDFVQYFWSTGQSTDCIIPSLGGTYTVEAFNDIGCSAFGEFTVQANPPLEAQILGNLNICLGDATTLTGVGGSNYFWSTNEQSEVITITQSGLYCLTVVDAIGCSGSTCVEVLESPLPEPTIAGSTTFCTGTSTVLDAGIYESYLWSNGQTTSSIEVTSEGNYEVTVSNAEGCTGSGTILITESTALQPIPIGPANLCDGGGIIGTGPTFTSYQWSTGETTPTISVTESNEYCLTVSSLSGCTGELCIDAQISSPIEVEATIVNPTCGLNDGMFALDVVGGTAPYTYETDQGISPPFNNIAGGTYVITITDFIGCSVIETIVLEEDNDLVVELQTPNESYCGCQELIPVYDTNANLSISWLPNAEEIDGSYYACANGSYGYILTNTLTGCFVNANTDVTLNDDADDEGCVWPGDTDYNGIVNNYDCLNIGIGFGDNGNVRPSGDATWRAQYPSAWLQNTPSTNINYMHVDCDGGGSIGYEDFDVVKDNWLLTHNFTDSEPQYRELPIDTRSPMDIPFYVKSDTLKAESDAVLDIVLGDASNQVVGAYGIAFSILYDPNIIVPNTASVSWDASWLGDLDSDLYAIEKDFHNEGRIEIGVTRLDGNEIGGFGKIAELNITIEDVILFKEDNENRMQDTTTFFRIDNYRIITAMETEIVANAMETPSIITDATTSTSQIDLDKFISVFPNPTNAKLTIESSHYEIQSIEIFSISGQSISTYEFDNISKTIDVSLFESGLYLIQINTTKGIGFKKVSIFK